MTLNNVDLKEFLDLSNLTNENLAVIRAKQYDEEKEVHRIAKTLTDDQKVIEQVLLYDGEVQKQSILQSNWSKFKNTGDQQELIDYIKFLTGVTSKTRRFGAGMMMKLGAKKKEKSC